MGGGHGQSIYQLHHWPEPGSMGQLDLNDFVHILPKSKATEKISKNK